MKTPLFIVIEGIDGAGKTTQIKQLSNRIIANNFGHTICVREPGETTLGTRLREILKDSTQPICSESELFLMAASRSQLVKDIIKPHLENDGICLADRYYHSTIAYQGYGRGLPIDLCWAAIKGAIQGVTPTITFWIDIPLEMACHRIAERGGQDRFESNLKFLSRVHEGYRKLWEDGGLVRIDGTQTIDVIRSQIWENVTPLL